MEEAWFASIYHLLPAEYTSSYNTYVFLLYSTLRYVTLLNIFDPLWISTLEYISKR